MKQITILARLQTNVIGEATEILAREGVSIDSITGEHYGTQTVVNITVDNLDKALYALQKRLDWQIVSEDALIVQVRDEVGALARLAGRLSGAGAVIRSIRFVERNEGMALVAIAAENMAVAREVMRDAIVG